MTLRKKVYSWYLLAVIFTLIVISLTKIKSDPVGLVGSIFSVLLSVIPTAVFLEYGVFLRIERIRKAIDITQTEVILDHGHDEISDIVAYLNKLTNQKSKFEQELRDANQQVDYVLNDASVMIQRFDKDGKVLYINNAYARHFGIADREKFMKESNIFSFLETKGYEDFDLRKDLMTLTKKEPLGERVYKRRSEKGSVLWVNRAKFDDYGNTLEYHTIGIDITKTKELEEQLKLLADNISSVVLWVDCDMKLNYASSDAIQIHPLFRLGSKISTERMLREIKLGNGGDIADFIEEHRSDKKPVETTAILFNHMTAVPCWYKITVRYLEESTLVLFDDIDDKMKGDSLLRKSESMRAFTFDLINKITSRDLKLVKHSICKFASDIGAHLGADSVMVALYDKTGVRVISRWDLTPIGIKFSNPPMFVLQSDWWNRKFKEVDDEFILINNVSEIEDNSVMRILTENNIKSVIATPVSFNHTNIGTIFIYSQSKKDWCDVDALTVKMSGRLIGMTLRPIVKKTAGGVVFDKKII